ncbi:DNA-directed RNA polymerases I and III subunit RPAC2 [Triplophysa rosa]|uniref:DNA-directed RNA polymerases I and III subunit RPAC2 n=1 Tax=Triplophysa rosa TaxID=992332 RepID=A0A9W7T3N9_TRIRA|nr:DNA-directed RNA polymerases I and III subunit RPAC2 [Triplophysa rosa]
MVEKCSVLESVQADGADEGSVTFVLQEEDHTLGNSLRYIIMKRGGAITHLSMTSWICGQKQKLIGWSANKPLQQSNFLNIWIFLPLRFLILNGCISARYCPIQLIQWLQKVSYPSFYSHFVMLLPYLKLL